MASSEEDERMASFFSEVPNERRSPSSLYRDWAWLPRNLLCSILEKFVQFSDYIHFSGACRQWHHYALEAGTDEYKQRLHILKACHNKLPMLMIDAKENHKSDKRLLCSVTEGITYQVQLPLPCHKRFIGSSFGWLFTIEKGTMVITLLNPFTGGLVSLPPFKDPYGDYEYHIDEDPEHYIKKAILSSFLSPNNYEVVIIYGSLYRLAHLKYGDDSWNFIHSDNSFVFSDVICCREGQAYAVNYWSKLVKINFASGKKIALTKGSTVCANATYLVQSQEGDLLLVQRYWGLKPDGDLGKTLKFAIFKLVHSPGEKEATWIQVKSLGNQALFLGDNHSMSISTLEFPDCLPNCIYYTQQYHVHIPPYVCCGIDEDTGIFNLEKESFQPLYISDLYIEKNDVPPIWFVPNMKGT